MAYGSSYGMAGVNKGFLEQMMKQNQGEKEAGTATIEQKKEMQAKFQAELEAAQARARKKSKKFGGLGKLLDVAGMFMGPLGAGLTGGIKTLMEGMQAKKGAKSLMSGIDSERYGKTFLSKGMDDYKKEADESVENMGSFGDMLGGSLMAGLGSAALSSASGAEKGGMFKDMFTPQDVVKEGSNLGFSKGGKAGADFSSKAGGLDNSLSIFNEKSANFDAFSKDMINKGPSFTSYASQGGGKITPIKNLIGGTKDRFKNVVGDNFKEEGLKGMDIGALTDLMKLMQGAK